MVISCLYVQTVTRQCFCFPNSQWGVTTHDNMAEIIKVLELGTKLLSNPNKYGY